MIALENMKQVNLENLEVPSLENWNWIPDVADLEALSEKLSGPRASLNNIVTSRNTFASQVDHGEQY